MIISNWRIVIFFLSYIFTLVFIPYNLIFINKIWNKYCCTNITPHKTYLFRSQMKPNISNLQRDDIPLNISRHYEFGDALTRKKLVVGFDSLLKWYEWYTVNLKNWLVDNGDGYVKLSSKGVIVRFANKISLFYMNS